jgi:hypothetical protein
MGQMNKGLREQDPDSLVQSIGKQLESLDHHLWNGNIRPALGIVDHLQWLVEDDTIGLKRKNLLKAVRDFGNYIQANREYIPNYGDRYRNEETITTSFVESAVNQVVSRRMVKKQPMRWSQKGAHLLLQVRTQVLNDEFRKTFQSWYPGLKAEAESEQQLRAA